MAHPQWFGEYHIGEGGLLRRFELAARLTSLPRQIATLLVLTWVPIVGLGLVDERWAGRPNPLIHDAAVHVRLVVAAPTLLALDRLFPWICRRTLVLLDDHDFVPDVEWPRFEWLMRRAARMTDSFVPELVLAIVCVGLGAAALLGVLPVRGIGAARPLTAAQIWYGVADLPVFHFLLWRSLWRWAIWVRVLAGLARIRLDLVPTHPDRRGGIAFLRLPSIGYCGMLLFAVSSVICAELDVRLAFGQTIASFKPLLVVFAIGGATVSFGPLLVFVPQLVRARERGLAESSGHASDHARSLRARRRRSNWRWDAIDPQETQAYASFGQIYREQVDRLTPLLFDKRDALVLLAATLLPVAVVMLARVPFDDWMDLVGILTGGVPY